jgi:hypothetical protein
MPMTRLTVLLSPILLLATNQPQLSGRSKRHNQTASAMTADEMLASMSPEFRREVHVMQRKLEKR